MRGKIIKSHKKIGYENKAYPYYTNNDDFI